MQKEFIYKVPAKALADVLKYLTKRPYDEVALLIEPIGKLIGEQNAENQSGSVHEEQRTSSDKSEPKVVKALSKRNGQSTSGFSKSSSAASLES